MLGGLMRHERALRATLLVIPFVFLAHTLRPDSQDMNIDSFWALKISAGPVHDVVIAGDSRVNQGVSPAAMQRVLAGQRILNFGFTSACMNAPYVQAAADKLDLKAKQPTLILALSPFSLSPRAAEQSGFVTYSEVPRAERFWYLYALPLANFFKPYATYELVGPPKLTRRRHFPDGWEEQATDESRPLASQDLYKANFTGNSFSAELAGKLAEQIKTLTARGIRVVAFRMPAYPELQKLEDELSGWNEMALRSQLESAGAMWLTFDASRYEYYDGSHLPAHSALKFSEDLARAIAELENKPN